MSFLKLVKFFLFSKLIYNNNFIHKFKIYLDKKINKITMSYIITFLNKIMNL